MIAGEDGSWQSLKSQPTKADSRHQLIGKKSSDTDKYMRKNPSPPQDADAVVSKQIKFPFPLVYVICFGALLFCCG